MTRSFTALVVTYNSEATILGCLLSLAECGPNHQVVVIDNASTDRTLARIEGAGIKCEIIRNKKNAGFSVACNQGLAKASHEFTLFLNPDAVLLPDSAGTLLSFLVANPDYVGAGPYIHGDDGTVQRACARRHLSLWSATCQLLWLDQLWRHSRLFSRRYYQPFDYDRPVQVECISGAAMMCRTDGVRTVGGFDETVPLYLDDIDLCRKLGRVGKIGFVPTARVEHVHNVSGRQIGDRAVRSLSLEASYVYLRKHAGVMAAVTYRGIVLLASVQAWIAAMLMYAGHRYATASRLYVRASCFLIWVVSGAGSTRHSLGSEARPDSSLPSLARRSSAEAGLPK